jgi:hypothetical protein
MNKQDIARKLKDAILLYIDATIDEQFSKQKNKEADKSWAAIEKYIKQLTN